MKRRKGYGIVHRSDTADREFSDVIDKIQQEPDPAIRRTLEVVARIMAKKCKRSPM